MEYAVFISEIQQLPADPRSLCADTWQKLLPPAPLRAVYFGSEFCEDLLPTLPAVERFCLFAAEKGVEPVLLTSMVTPKGLSALDHLLQGLAGRCTPTLVVNDWGVLNLVRRSHPLLPRRAGRLMNRGLRDPRQAQQQGSPIGEIPAGDARHEEARVGGGPHQGARDERSCDQPPLERNGRLRALLMQFGIEALETDPDLGGNFLGESMPGLQRVLHFPYAFAATGRNCLVKADGTASAEECFTKGLGRSCPGLCRGRCHRVTREDTQFSLWRSGNTIFFEAPHELAAAHLVQADRVVLYQRPAA